MPFAAGRSRGCRKGSCLENEPEVHTSQVGSGDGPPTHHPIPVSQPIHRSGTFPPYKRCPRWREVDQHPHRTAPCTPTPTHPEAQRGLGLTRSGPSLPPSLPTTRCWAAGAPGRSSCCAARCTAGTATAPVPPPGVPADPSDTSETAFGTPRVEGTNLRRRGMGLRPKREWRKGYRLGTTQSQSSSEIILSFQSRLANVCCPCHFHSTSSERIDVPAGSDQR